MLKLRPATEHDIPQIISLHVSSWRENYTKSLSSDFLMSDEVEKNRTETWNKRLNPPFNAKQYVAVAEVDDELVGFICVYLDKHDELRTYIENLHVKPDHHKHGVGTHLMHKAAEWIEKNRPNEPIYLEAYAENEPAQKFYTNLGGKRTDKPFEVDAVDGGRTQSYHVTWENSAKLITAIERKISLNNRSKSRAKESIIT